MPWDENGNGKVFKVLSLDSHVMVYGDRGIAGLKNTIVEGRHAMEFKHMATLGVISTYAVNGDDKIHGFVDQNYDWNIVTGEGIKNLGYRDFLSAMTGTIVVSYEANEGRFYISNGLKCYVFNGVGMYATNQCVSSIGQYKNILVGFVKDNADTKIRIETTAFDLGYQDNKTIESIETGLVYDTVANEVVYGKLAVRYDYKGDFTTLALTQLNDRGILTQKITGREFKLFLQGDYEAGATFRLNGVKVKTKFSDKRNTRGRINVS